MEGEAHMTRVHPQGLLYVICCLAVLCGLVVQSSGAADAADVARAGEAIGRDNVGREIRKAEDAVIDAPAPRKDGTAPEIVIPPPATAEAEEKTDPDDPVWKIESVSLHGDMAMLSDLGVAARVRALVDGQSLKRSVVRDRMKRLTRELIDEGYYLANLWVRADACADGVLTVEADLGRVGEQTFAYEGGREDGKYFSTKQLRRRMAKMSSGGVFDYDHLYDALFELNSHPDLTINTDLHVRQEIEDERLVRYVDTAFDVKESLPLHMVLDVDNYGTEATDEWGMRLTAQHLNLTKHDDVLTLSALSSIDFESMQAIAASYYWPYAALQGGGFTMYGGYSELDAQEVVESIDIVGDGWFAGLQWSHNFLSTPNHLVKVSLGVIHRYIEDQLFVVDVETEPRDVTVMPFSLAVSYTSKQADWLGGRNFATVQGLYNAGDTMGTSDDEEISTQRDGAEADYTVGKLQVARVQPIFGRRGEDGRRAGQWILFGKFEGQIADGPLIPAEQIGVGGAKTVRGYLDREYLGDDGAFATLELRTPLLLGLCRIPWLTDSVRDKRGTPIDRLQIVSFVDAGYAAPEDDDSQDLLSVGVGVRLAITSHAQLKVDWGFPMEETDESTSDGAGHVNLQVQF